MQGFISLHRKLKDNPVWSDPHYLKLWVYCLFEATHKEHEQLVGNKMVKLQRGQFVKGRFTLHDDLNRGMKPKQRLSEKTWWRYLENLEKWGMLTIKSTNKYSIITVVKYDTYQDVFNKVDHQTDQQMTNNCPTNDQQMTTNNNVNKGNNANKKDSRSKLKFETKHMQLADLLFKLIKKNNPNVKQPKLEQWADTFRKIMEIDKKEGKKIQEIIIWSQQDNFWHKNILSPDSLRKQFDRLSLEIMDKKKSSYTEPRNEPKMFDLQKALGNGE